MFDGLKQRIKASLKAAGGSEAVSAQMADLERTLADRLDKVNHDLHIRLDAMQTDLERRLHTVEHKINQVEQLTHGGRSTYVGANRVLMKIVVAGRNIAYFVEADDRLISPWFIVTGGYETELTNYFVRELKPASHCLDVGSNFGYFTCLMGRFSDQGKVLAIEADKHVFELARDNIYINGFGHFATVIHAAASDSPGQLDLYRRVTRSGTTSITKADEGFVRSIGEPTPERFTVAAVRVDDVVAQRLDRRVDFMKVDVEGAEPLVFEGARATIAANPQLNIVMEWSPGQIKDAGFDIPEFLARLDGMGLKPFDILEDRIEPLTYAQVAAMPYRAGLVLTKAA
jgi:FkbM family methyltransferase